MKFIRPTCLDISSELHEHAATLPGSGTGIIIMQLSTVPHVLLSGLHLLRSHKPFNKCNQQWSFQYKTL